MNNLKCLIYMPIGDALEEAQFTTNNLLNNAGLKFKEEFDLLFITCKTSKRVYDWLNKNNFRYHDVIYNDGKGFLYNLYTWWNTGYNEGFKLSDRVIAIGSDHAFYKDCIKNLIKWSSPDHITNCRLIEKIIRYPQLHLLFDLGYTQNGYFNEKIFNQLCKSIYKEECIDERKYPHRCDASPFVMTKQIWDKYGPWNTEIINGVTGDTAFFDLCRASGIIITKAMDAISYHYGCGESDKGKKENRYS